MEKLPPEEHGCTHIYYSMSENPSNYEDFLNFESQISTLINLDSPAKNTKSKSKVNTIMASPPNESLAMTQSPPNDNLASNTRSKSKWGVVKKPLVYLHDSPSNHSAVKKLHVKRRIITTEEQCPVKVILVPFADSLNKGADVEPTYEHSKDSFNAI